MHRSRAVCARRHRQDNRDGLSFAVCPGRDAASRLIMGKIVGLCDAVVAVDSTYSPSAEAAITGLSDEFSLPVLYVSPSRVFLLGE